jgi:hypothetical protein
LDLASGIEWEGCEAQGFHLDRSSERPIGTTNLDHAPGEIFFAFAIETFDYCDGLLTQSGVRLPNYDRLRLDHVSIVTQL